MGVNQKYIGFLNIDAVFMPVVNVNYKIHNVYVSYNKTTESLALEITTNGSLTPEKALSEAAQKLMLWFSSLSNEEYLTPEKEIEVEPIPQPEVILIEELVQYSQEEIKEIKNFGKKSADEVFQALK